MIRLDGYYIFKPVLFQERKEFKPWYSLVAYYFNENKEVLIARKWLEKNTIEQFTKDDFMNKESVYKYEVNEDEFILKRAITSDWVEKFYYDRISNEELINRQTKEIIKFVPWDDYEK